MLNLQTQQSELLRRYDFNSRFADDIIDLSKSASPLNVPKPGNFPDKRTLQVTDYEDQISNNRVDLVVNFIGFWPLGFFVAVVLRQNYQTSRYYLLPFCGAVLIGGLVSFGIEISQPQIPGRNSHLHDLVLNILGAATGGLGFVLTFFIADKLKQARLRPVAIPPE